MSEKIQLGILGLMGLSIAVLGVLVALGHDTAITDGLMALCGGSGTLGAWEYIKSKGTQP